MRRLALMGPGVLVLCLVSPPKAQAIGAYSKVRLAELVLPGVKNPWRNGIQLWAATIAQRANVPMSPRVTKVKPGDRSLWRQPLLITATDKPLPALSAGDAARLRRHLSRGGTWIIDGPADASAQIRFTGSVKRIARQLFPRGKLSPVGVDHTLFKSYYLIAPGWFGRRVLGLARDKRAALIVTYGIAASASGSMHGLARKYRLRLGVNAVLYALCVDYKSDQVHTKAILRRRKWRVR